MFMLLIFMFACSLAFMFACTFAFPLFVFAKPVFALAGVAVTFAFAAVFELSAAVQPAEKTVAVSRIRKAVVRSIEVPPMCIRSLALLSRRERTGGLLEFRMRTISPSVSLVT